MYQLSLFTRKIIGFCLLCISTLAFGATEPTPAGIYNTIDSIQKKWQTIELAPTKPQKTVSTEPVIVESLNGEGIPEGELLFFSSYLKRHYLGEVLAIKSQRSVWVDLASFFENLDFAIDIDNDKQTAEGWFISPENTFFLNATNQTVKINNNEYQFEQQFIYIDAGDIFIDAKQLELWFALEIGLDYSALELHFSSQKKLPIEKRLAREERNISTSKAVAKPVLPWKSSPYKMLSSPLADIQISSVTTEGDSTVGYSILGANDLAYFGSEYYFAGREGNLLSDSRLSFNRESLTNELLGPLGVTTLQFGDVLATQIGSRFNSRYARGIKIDNKPLFKDINSNQINLTGAIQPGWDIEVYRNGVLIGQQLSLTDGRYLFENIDLLFGSNNFELVLYGPQGQVERKTQQYFIDGNSLQRGESFYELSITEQGHQLFNQSRYLTGEDGWHLAGRYETGLTNYLSVYGGLSVLNKESGERSENYAMGSNLSIAERVLINIDYEQNNQKETELELAARGELAGQSVRLSMQQRKFLQQSMGTEYSMSNTDTYELSINGALFQQDYGSLNYQNTISHTDSDIIGSRVSIDNTLSYSLDGILLSNKLRWLKNDAADDNTLLGSARLQGRLGRIYSRFSVDYTVNPLNEVLGYQAEFNRSFGANFQAELTLKNRLKEDLTSAVVGLNWQNERFSLNSNVSYDNDDNWRVGLFSRFSLGFDSQSSGYFISKRSLARSGSLMVQVYLDENNNGIKDSNEAGIEGVKVKGVQNHRQAITDQDGMALLTSMPANRTTDIMIDPESFPNPFYVAANNGFSITPRAGFVEYMNIALNNASEIEGVVYQQHGDDTKAQPFATIKLIDKQGNKVAETQAAYDGYYLFTDMRPGEYQAVISEPFKERKSLKSTQEIIVNLPPEGDVIMGVDFVLKQKNSSAGYIASLGRFSSPSIMKAYFQLIKQHLNSYSQADVFYLKDKNRYTLAVGYAQSTDNNLSNICKELKLKGLNCSVQAQLIKH